ncbi:MAG: urate hydroxylase PuuD [Mariprofundus sp.]|nr:urate hydroxylase PuuD [Mariprofundus sp.]
MKIFTDHKLALITGFVLAAVFIGIGASNGNMPTVPELARWGHFLAGITWIGLLYYLNFCQVPSMGGLSADTKADLFKDSSVVRRVMWWFRWGAMLTLIFGIVLYMDLQNAGAAGWDIRIGGLFGIIMWFNVWFIIWPAQKKILGITEATADEKAALGKRALIASRTNTILSIPMLLLMASSAHFRLFG